MDGTEQKFMRSIEQFHMLQPGGRVIAAVSGGADSVCLLALLCGLKLRWDIVIRAVHVHHGLRGAEADRDARYVEELCGRLCVPVKVVRVDVRGYAGGQGLSEEEAGRVLRYRTLEAEAEAWEREETLESSPGTGRPPVRIAVAHHGDDQAETILHNLCRGSGLAGLGGMQPVNGRIIRPLLSLGRADILAWLESQNLEFCQDSTNQSDHYTRNRIRAGLIPAIEAQVNAGAVDNILRMGRIASQADGYLREQARQWIGLHVVRDEEPGDGQHTCLLIPETEFLELADILRSYTVYLLLCETAGQARDLTAAHVDQVLELFGKPVGRRASLPCGVSGERRHGAVALERGARAPGPGREAEPQAVMTCFPYKKGMEIPKNQYTKWFDCDRIKGMPVVRKRQTGDYITLADGNKKTVRRFMIDEKIPREIRDQISLLADGDHVMWIIGYRISEYYKIGPDTTRVLQAGIRQMEPEYRLDKPV